MNKITFLVPIYPPHFKYAENIIKTWQKYKLDTQSDIWFIFTNDEEHAEFRDWNNSIVLPAEFRIFENRGIINIKKLYAIQQLKDKYDYICVLDSETEFLKNVNLLDICDNYFNKRELYGNLVYEEGRERTEKIKAACKEYFYQYENIELLNTDFYLWFNQPCIYKTDNIDDFLEKIDFRNNLSKLRWEDFDYYLYMYYLLLFRDFKIVDIGIDSNYGICETSEAFLTFRNNNYLKANIYMCSKSMVDLFNNPNLFLAIHVDRDINWIIRLMHAKITKLDSKVHMLENYNEQPIDLVEKNEILETFKNINNEKYNIESSDISVVVQGAVNKNITPQCLQSIREFLPDAEVILSTWQGSDVDELDYDILILNKDPGAVKTDLVNNVTNNQNRQLVSTREGVFKANKKYILKLRTDFILHSSKFLEYWNKFSIRDEKYNIFRHKIISSSVFSREYSDYTHRPILFHPSDFFLFGLAEDLKDYFKNIRFATDNELGNWQYLYPNKIPYPEAHYRYAPEQFFLLSYVKQFFPNVDFEDWSDWNEINQKMSKNILYNNFIFLDYKQAGIYSEKFSFELKNPDSIFGLISFKRYEEVYKKDFDNTYDFEKEEPIDSEQNESEEVHVQKEPPIGYDEYHILNMKFKKHLSYFITPFKKIITWLWQPIPILYNFVKLFFNIYFIRRLLSCLILDKQKRRNFRGDI